MPLHSPINVPERIMLYGPAGAGKTFAYFCIAKWLMKTGSTAHMRVLDTDRTVERTLVTEFPELMTWGQFHYKVCTKWKSLTAATTEFADASQPGDWLVCDMVGPQSWKFVQNYYHEAKHGKTDADLADFLLQEAARAKKGQESEGWNWQFINGVFDAWKNEYLLDSPAHVLGTAGVAALSKDDDKATRVTFGPLGLKPVGQKDIKHAFHTALLVTAARAGEPEFTTAKDRGRQVLDHSAIQDFATGYLVNVAGWKLA